MNWIGLDTSPFPLKEVIIGTCCNGKRHELGFPIIGDRIVSEGIKFELELGFPIIGGRIVSEGMKLELELGIQVEPELGIVIGEVLMMRMINEIYHGNRILLSSNDITCTGGRIDTF